MYAVSDAELSNVFNCVNFVFLTWSRKYMVYAISLNHVTAVRVLTLKNLPLDSHFKHDGSIWSRLVTVSGGCKFE